MSGFCDGEEFFDSDASEAHTIGPWLDRHHVTGPKNVGRPWIHPRRFMDEKADTVTDTVRELPFEPCLGEDRTAGRIDFAARGTRTHYPHACFTGATYHVVTQPHFVGTRAVDHESSGHVGVIAVNQSAEVDDDRVATVKLATGWVMMRKRGIWPGGNDRREAHIVGTKPAHRSVEFVAKLALGRARHDEWRHIRECSVGNRCSTLNSLEFGKALGSA